MEEAKSVIGVICSSYDSFFDSEKKIANCIMERKREVVDMTVAELAPVSYTHLDVYKRQGFSRNKPGRFILRQALGKRPGIR